MAYARQIKRVTRKVTVRRKVSNGSSKKVRRRKRR